MKLEQFFQRFRKLLTTGFFIISVNNSYGNSPLTGSLPSVQQSSCIQYCDTMPLYRTSSTGEVEVMNGVYQGVAQQYNNLASQVLYGVQFRARVNPSSGTSNNLKVTVYSV